MTWAPGPGQGIELRSPAARRRVAVGPISCAGALAILPATLKRTLDRGINPSLAYT